MYIIPVKLCVSHDNILQVNQFLFKRQSTVALAVCNCVLIKSVK